MGNVLFMRKGETHSEPIALPKIGTPLNDCTWEQISMISNQGLASSYFSVGDTKAITINGTVGATTFSNLSIDAFIIGIDHNSDIEGSNRIHFQIGKIGGVDVCLVDSKYHTTTTTKGAFTMKTTQSESNTDGWENCHMRKTVLGSDSVPDKPTANTLLAALPTELRTAMKPVIKYTSNTAGTNKSSYVTSTEDYLWLLSAFETLGSDSSYANVYENNYQKQYAYYSAGNSQTKYKHDATTTKADYYWTRSPHSTYENRWCDCRDYAYANYSAGIAPAFAV